MTEITPEKLDTWRWREAQKSQPQLLGGLHHHTDVVQAYRALVREDVQPPAEPDQDREDAKNIAWALGIDPSETFDWHIDAAADAIRELKSRVRREAIMALPDEVTNELLADGLGTMGLVNSKGWKSILAAIKQLYGRP